MEAVFEQLQPACIQLMSKQLPGPDELKKLLTAINSLDDISLNRMQNYVLYPLEVIIKRFIETPEKKQDHVLILLLQCVQQMFSAVKLDSSDAFRNWFIWVCLLGASPAGPRKVSDVSEELKLEIVQSLSSLLSSATSQARVVLYEDGGVPPLAHAVSLLLDLAQFERHTQLRVTALTCLQLLLLAPEGFDTATNVKVRQRSSIFLPGITSATCRLATSDPAVNHKVIVAAIRTYGKAVTQVLADQHVKDITTASSVQCGEAGMVTGKLPADWVQVTGERVKLLMVKLTTELVCHASWQVRQAVSHLAGQVCSLCLGSLSSSLPGLVTCLVTLACDEQREVTEDSQAVLASLMAVRGHPVHMHLADLVHSVSTSLPRAMTSLMEADRRTAVRSLRGALQALGVKVGDILSSAGHLHKLAMALLHCLHFDCSVSAHVSSTDSGPDRERPWYCFKYFSETSTYEEFRSICRTLAMYGDIQVIYDYLQGQCSGAHRKQAAWLLNELTTACASLEVVCARQQAVGCVVEQLVCEYISWTGRVRGETVGAGQVGRWEDRRAAIIELCLTLDGIGRCSQVLQQAFLIEALYVVMETLQHSSESVQQQADMTLTCMATALSYGCVGDMLTSNADYLVNDVGLRLRHLCLYPEAPRVLQSLLLHSGPDLLPLFDDIITEVLCQLDDVYLTRPEPLVHTLVVFISRIQVWFPASLQDKGQTVGDSDVTVVSVETLGQWLTRYHELHVQARTGDTDDSEHFDTPRDSADHAEQGDSDKQEVKVVERHIKLTLQICDRCHHLLTSGHTGVQSQCLDILAAACTILQGHQDELLPLIHRLWPNFRMKFSADPVAVHKAFVVLCEMAGASGDFMRQRVTKDVLPKLTALLLRSAKQSLSSGATYKHSPLCSLQAVLLSRLLSLCQQVDMGEDQLTGVLHAYLPYLSDKQPLVLQQACLTGIKCMAVWQPDYVWWRLVSLAGTPPPHPTGSVIQAKEEWRCADNASNVATLLAYLHTVNYNCVR